MPVRASKPSCAGSRRPSPSSSSRPRGRNRTRAAWRSASASVAPPLTAPPASPIPPRSVETSTAPRSNRTELDRRTLMLARRMPLLALFTANAISLTGTALTLIAVPWFVLQTTGSPAKTGVTAFCEFTATVLAAFFGGALVDRIGHRRASIAADLSSGGAIALIPALYYTVGLAFWQLLALVFCAAFFNAPGTTARSALVPDLAGLAGIRLQRAQSLRPSIQRGAMLLGAPIAGVLIAVLGTSRLLWLHAATLAVFALLVGFAVRAPAPQPAAQAAQPSSRYLADLRAGLRYIFGEPVVRVIVLAKGPLF